MHHIPTVTTAISQPNVTTHQGGRLVDKLSGLVQLVKSGVEASDSHQGVPGPPRSGDPWQGSVPRGVSPEVMLVAASPQVWQHCPLLWCPGGIVSPPLCPHPPLWFPVTPLCPLSCVPVSPPMFLSLTPGMAQVPEVPGLCPAGCPHVPQDASMAALGTECLHLPQHR